MESRAYTGRVGLEGILMVLSPLPLLFVDSEGDISLSNPELILSVLSSIMIFCSGLTLLKRPYMGKALGIFAVILGYIASLYYVRHNPIYTLAATVLFIWAFFAYFDFSVNKTQSPNEDSERALKRTFWGNIALLPILIFNLLFSTSELEYVQHVLSLSIFVAFVLYIYWAVSIKSKLHIAFAIIVIVSVFIMLYYGMYRYILLFSIIMLLISLVILPRSRAMVEGHEQWWEVILSHPARVLILTFFALCLFGTMLLLIPCANTKNSISLVDAVFTSVSAVCVTGLVVLDTPVDFTIFGQGAILLLIQLGGLGIMSITTVALHAMGRRLSLRQERLMTSMTDTHHKDLMYSLVTILKYTFIIECIGGAILAGLFYSSGDSFGYAVYRGAFTSISAFCNAGFALQSNSLVPYQSSPLILHTVALLIILGGIAPATVLFVPKWLSGKVTPIAARIALVTTVIMLFVGTIFILIFEWNGFLEELSIFDKLQNAWFQSATLRTAGFNSVPLSQCASPTYLIMLAFMFVGGSPGGTAGGIKTTTVGIIVMTFWANIMNKKYVVIHNRKIDPTTINRAVTIVISGLVILFLGIMMLEMTQEISARDLIFEITSAIGTVGLTVGATSQLDEIGKIIIILAMFAGRVGPMTLFMLIGDDDATDDSQCLIEKVSLT